MGDKVQAARELAKFGATFRNILELGPELEKLGNLEAEQKRLAQLSSKLTEETERMKASLVAGRKELEEMYATGKQAIREAQAQEKLILVNAEEKAKGLVRTAKEEAAKIVENASLTVKGFEARIKEKQNDLAKITVAVAEEEASFNSLKNRVAKFKETLVEA